MIEKSKVMAIVVTRGDVPSEQLEKIARTLIGFESVLFFEGVSSDVCDDVNGKFGMQLLSRDMKVYGRYGAAIHAYNERVLSKLTPMNDYTEERTADPLVIYVQDDDCVTDPEEILKHYEPGIVTCNMPPEFRTPVNDRGYRENPRWNVYSAGHSALVGFGAVFDASLIIPAFQGYLEKWPYDSLFLIECDRIFTALTYTKFVDVPVTQLPHAKLAGRLSTSADHDARYREVRRRIASVVGQ